MRILFGEELKDYIENDSIILDNEYCHITAKELVRDLKDPSTSTQLPFLLVGDRGNGKTTLLESCIKLINDYHHTAYITLEKSTLVNTYSNNYKSYHDQLLMELRLLKKSGIVNVFIDEITILKDFYYYGSNYLSDYLANHFKQGLKIITGTNSLILAETINSDDNYRVRYIIKRIPRFYTYTDYLKINPTLPLAQYLQNGALLRQINPTNPLSYLPFFVAQKKIFY